MTERLEQSTGTANLYHFDDFEQSPAQAQVYNDKSAFGTGSSLPERSALPESGGLTILPADYGVQNVYSQNAVPFDRWSGLGARAAQVGGSSLDGYGAGPDYRAMSPKRALDSYKPGNEYRSWAGLETEREYKARHDREVRRMFQEIENTDDRKYEQRVEKMGGRLPEINIPAPSEEQRLAANDYVDKATRESKEFDKLNGSRTTEQHFEDASKLQKAILAGDVKAVQAIMDSYKGDTRGLQKVIHESGNLVSGDAIVHYFENRDGSTTMTVNTDPTESQPIQPVVSFTNDGKTAPKISGHATLSSISTGAQHMVNDSLPGDPTPEKALANIGNAATVRLARRNH